MDELDLIAGGGGSRRQKRRQAAARAAAQVPAAPSAPPPPPQPPVEARDNLNSTQFVTLVDLISEGEIQGLKDGNRSIFLNDTPLQNRNGTYNFKNLQVFTRNGTQNQSFIPITGAIENELAVNVEVSQGSPITRSITNAEIDGVRVTISVPQLQEFRDNGDILGSAVRLQIQLQYNGGGFTTAIDDTIRGRTPDLYQRDYLVNLNGPFPVDVRVVRVTPNSATAKVVNAFSWTAYTEIIYAKLRYPNSALVAMRVDAEQFNQVPDRTYLVRGIKVRIPNNATVDQNNGRLIYSGIWNGTFGAAQWTTDPAWILWDLLTSTRYGFGDHIKAAQLDKFAFFAASQYASGLVPTGFGGSEPRFSCNVSIQGQEEAYKLINDMCSVFRVMPYWSTGALTISQDRPADSAYLFTLANVSEGGFSYSGGSLKGRPTVAVVSYLDLALRDTAYEVVEDQDAIAKYGVVKAEIQAFACTSRGQAARIGEWLLYSEQFESEIVEFTTSVDAGVLVRPGQIIDIADPMRAGSRRGGRISAATTTTVTVDDATGLPTADGTLSVILPDGAVQTRNVSSRSGAVITVSTAFTAAPNVNSVWIYQTSTLQTAQWRVLTVQEQEGSTYTVTALSHNASKYDFIERDRPLQFRDTTDLNIIPPSPENLQAEEVLYENGGQAFSKLIISWKSVLSVTQYRVRWRYEGGNWTTATVDRPDYEIFDTQPGFYEVEVFSVATSLRVSPEPATLAYNAGGLTDPPADVTGLAMIAADEGSAVLTWDRAIDLDVLLGGKVLIRHERVLTGAKWSEGQSIVAAAAGSQTQKLVPLLEGTYMVKFEDATGNRSITPALVVVRLPQPQPRLLVKTYAEDAEDPPFSGNRIDMIYVAEFDGLVIATGVAVDDMATDGDWDALPSIDSIGSVLPFGEYEFGSTFDMGAVYDVNLQRRFFTRPYLPAALWDDKEALIDTWPTIDEDDLDQVDAELYVRTTDDDPGIGNFGEWVPFVNAITRGRGFQFKTIARSFDPDLNIVIDELGAVMELQQHAERSAVLTSGAGTHDVTFDNAFYEPPTVGLTGFNMLSGDFFEVASVTRTGFQVTFKNSGGSAVSRNFTYTAIGFGREI